MKKIFISLALIISTFILTTSALAHPGNTDSSGCHTCRTNCVSWGLSTGEYHCHNAKTSPQPLADKKLSEKLKGRILLQVENKGEAYYIDSEGASHYLKDGAAAYEAMRNLGLGITNNDLRKIEISEIKK